jgi:hypothetical protein
MPFIAYKPDKLRAVSRRLVEHANVIIEDYAAKGFTLTLRQLYYQFVTRNLLSNNDKSYGKLGAAVTLGRVCGLIDWNAIEDRLRAVITQPSWSDAHEMVAAARNQFRMDRWRHQTVRPEVWIEKDALTGVIEGPCRDHDVPYFACRGNVSQSALWRAAQRFDAQLRRGQQPVVLHLGDHDPSGIDMTRDNQDRLDLMVTEGHVEVRRIALNMDQVEELDLAPNPAKSSDRNWDKYVQRFQVTDSWELDAMSPEYLVSLLVREIRAHKDEETWEQDLDEEADEMAKLTAALETMSTDSYTTEEDE